MGEMGGGSVVGALAQNILFRGGDVGNDSALLLHSHGGAGGALEAHTGEAIGNSGICEGGWAAAMDACDDALVDPDDFKFFFNYVQFTDNEIEGMLAEEDSAGDAWASVEVPSSFILDSDYARGEAWTYLRSQLREEFGKGEA